MVKTKVRFDGLDVAAMVAHWNRECLGRRLVNIYNGSNGDTYVFKLEKKGDETMPMLLVMESGIRFHTTQQPSENPAMPSPFCSKLRKHLRGLRLEGIQQLGQRDRVVNLIWGSGNSRHSLILELYARGNLILTNQDYTILSLLRSHDYQNNENATTATATATNNDNDEANGKDNNNNNNDAKNKIKEKEKNMNASKVKVQVGRAYPITYATTASTTITVEEGDVGTAEPPPETFLTCHHPMEWFQQQQQQKEEQVALAALANTTTSSKKTKKADTHSTAAWRALFMGPTSGVSHYGPSLLDHCLICAGVVELKKQQQQQTGKNNRGQQTQQQQQLQVVKLPTDLNADEWKDLQQVLKTQGDEILRELDLASTTTTTTTTSNSNSTGTGTGDATTTTSPATTTTVGKGYILYQPKQQQQQQTDGEGKDDTSSSSLTITMAGTNNENNEQQDILKDKILLEFQPHLLRQHMAVHRLEYPTFDQAVDVFFSNMEGQKQLLRVETQQQQAQQRLEKIKQDQQQRITALLEQQELLQKQAQLIEIHATPIDQAIQVVNSALDSGRMDWDQLTDLIRVEQEQNNNPIAKLIHQLHLEQDAMTLRLENLVVDDNDDNDHVQPKNDNRNADNNAPKKKFMDVKITLKDTAHGNASALFAKYRASKEKSQKTIEATTKALKAAEDTAQKQFQDASKRQFQATTMLTKRRKPLWFEKFHWFITSDNYLVIAGRDAQQNELLVKRYLRPGDAYLHADVHGAASCILRAKRRRQKQSEGGTTTTQTLPLSDQALREAGHFTICRSSAWGSRMVTSAWWVEAHQVSKTAPTGEYLTVGSFMIRGKKTFLPATPLEMGLGVLFRLGDEEGIARHKNERRDFALMQLEQEDDDDDDDDHDAIVNDNNITSEVPNKSKSINDDTDDTKETTEEKVAKTIIEESDEKKEPPVVSSDEGNANGKTTMTSGGQEQSDEAIGDGDDGDDGDDDDKGSQDEEDNDEEDGNGESKDEDNVAPAPAPNARKGLSARDRKLIKKYGSLEAAEKAEEERLRQEEERKSKNNQPGKNQPTPKKQQQQQQSSNQKRGRKAKQKKMAKKYADQDEEDRELAMLLLHAGEKEKKSDTDNKKTKGGVINETEKEAAAQTVAILKKDPAVMAEQLSPEVREVLGKCVTVKSNNKQNEEDAETAVIRWDKFDADVLDQLNSFEREEEKLAAAQRLLNLKEQTRIDNFSASLAGIIRTIRKYGHKGLGKDDTPSDKKNDDAKRKTKAEKEAENESWKKTLAQEGVLDDELDEDAVDDTIELSKLTGKPHNEDLILFAVPICAPYQTLSQYAYRVKLTPGNMKRGKAAKGCIEMFLKDGQQRSALTDRNKEFIKRVPDNEWVQALCGDVKISAAGASKAIQKQKAKAKNKSKKKK